MVAASRSSRIRPFPPNEYRIYAGARNLTRHHSRRRRTGRLSAGRSNPTVSSFTSAEINQIERHHDDVFESRSKSRRDISGFAALGRRRLRSIRDGSTTWHFNHTTAPAGSVTDFYSVAIHELAHALGFGIATKLGPAWLVSGSKFFTAPTAMASVRRTRCRFRRHWRIGRLTRSSVVYGTAQRRKKPRWTPTMLNGTRKQFTDARCAPRSRTSAGASSPPPTPAPATTTATASSTRPTMCCGGIRSVKASPPAAAPTASGNGSIGHRGLHVLAARVWQYDRRWQRSGRCEGGSHGARAGTAATGHRLA